MVENPLTELQRIAYKLPPVIFVDVDKRVTDWLAGGGKETDPYIHQQLRFVQKVLASMEAS